MPKVEIPTTTVVKPVTQLETKPKPKPTPGPAGETARTERKTRHAKELTVAFSHRYTREERREHHIIAEGAKNDVTYKHYWRTDGPKNQEEQKSGFKIWNPFTWRN
jgi:hypothetical protein